MAFTHTSCSTAWTKRRNDVHSCNLHRKEADSVSYALDVVKNHGANLYKKVRYARFVPFYLFIWFAMGESTLYI